MPQSVKDIVMRPVEPVSTARLTLRPLHKGDETALFPTLSDPQQCLYLSRPEFASEAELWGWLSDPTWNGRTWIAEDADGKLAARLVAVPGHEDGVEEVGYITCADRQWQGIASEGMRALIDHLFAQGTRKLTAEVDAENAASIALLNKLGFTREAYFREHETTHAGLRDVCMYGLLASERS